MKKPVLTTIDETNYFLFYNSINPSQDVAMVRADDVIRLLGLLTSDDLSTALGYKSYVAILNQAAPEVKTDAQLIIGETYEITDYLGADDFTNVGATVNQTGEIFIATGTTPAEWGDSSELTSYGNPVATVLKNELSAPIVWSYNNAGSYLGSLLTAFPDNKVMSFVTPRNAGDNNPAQVLSAYVLDNDTIGLFSATIDSGGTEQFADDLFIGQVIEIRVYT